MREDKIKKCDEWIDSYKKLFDAYNDITSKEEYKYDVVSFTHLDSYEVDDERFFLISIDFEDIKTRKEICEEVSLFLDEKYITEYMYIASSVLAYYLESVCKDEIVRMSDFYNPSFYGPKNAYLDFSGLFDAKFVNAYNEIVYFDDILNIMINNANKGAYEDNKLIIELFKNAIDNESLDDNMDYSIHSLKDQTSLALRKVK